MTRPIPPLFDGFLDEALGLDERPASSLEPVAALALAAPAVAPPERLRARLRASVEATHRFDDLEARVAEILDVPTAVAAAFLRALDGPPEAWGPGPRPGVSLLHVAGGPRVERAVTGFVRVEVGAAFPEHVHVGDETVLVLQGALEDSGGAIHGAGETVRMAAGSSHHFRAVGRVRLLTLAVVESGVVVDGQTLGPRDPRA